MWKRHVMSRACFEIDPRIIYLWSHQGGQLSRPLWLTPSKTTRRMGKDGNVSMLKVPDISTNCLTIWYDMCLCFRFMNKLSDRKRCLVMVSNNFAWRFSSIVYFKDFPTYSSRFPQQLLPEGLRKFCSSAVTFIRSGSGKIQLPSYQGIQYQPLSIPNLAWLLNCYNQRVSARIFLLDDGARRHRRIVHFEFLRTGCRSFLWNLCEELVAKQMPKRSIFIRATLVAEVTSTLLFIQVGLFSQGFSQWVNCHLTLEGRFPKSYWPQDFLLFFGNPQIAWKSISMYRCPKMMRRTETGKSEPKESIEDGAAP